MRGSDVLAEQPGAGAADKAGAPFESALPKRGIDGRIVNDADQVAQALLIMRNRLTRPVQRSIADVTLSFQNVPRLGNAEIR